MKCAVYTRVSTDKEDQKKSLINQREMFIKYIADRCCDLFNVYVDVQSGTKAAKRIQLKQMLRDAKEKKFDIILAKELSRLARNEAISYQIRDMAEQNGLHIITLDGAINTLEGTTSNFGLFAWLYENESQNTSRRIKNALNTRAYNGLFKGSIPPYRYSVKEGKFYIKEYNTPNIVRRIYKEYIAGDGQDVIARRLWEEAIPTPSQVAGKVNSSPLWHGSTIMKILKNRAYMGDMVQSKTCTISVTSSKRKQNVEKNFIAIKDTHEPIITKETFQTVQELIKTRSKLRKVTHKIHLFSNILFCTDCHHGMHFKENRRGYVCGAYGKRGTTACTDHIIREDELKSIVLTDIKLLTQKIKNTNFSNLLEKKVLKQKQKIEIELKKFDKEISSFKQKKLKALYNLNDSIITKDDYDLLVTDINSNLKNLIKKQHEYSALIAKYAINNYIHDLSKLQEQICNITDLTPEIFYRFLERIEIKQDGSPKIF